MYISYVFCHFRTQPGERTRFTVSHLLWFAAVTETFNGVQRIGFALSTDLSFKTGKFNNTNLLKIWKENLENYYCQRGNADFDRAYFI